MAGSVSGPQGPIEAGAARGAADRSERANRPCAPAYEIWTPNALICPVVRRKRGLTGRRNQPATSALTPD